jgi:hypothetical protein
MFNSDWVDEGHHNRSARDHVVMRFVCIRVNNDRWGCGYLAERTAMLARLQSVVVVVIALVAVAWLSIAWALEQYTIAIVGSIFIGLGYTILLAVEFVFLACLHRDDPTARANLSQLMRAWCGECMVSLLVFGWRQPFRAKALSNITGRGGARGIVFVHGYLCNRGFWNPWLARCALERRPCIAVDLEPVFSGLEAYEQAIERALAQLERQTGLPPLIVCHSMGGLAARAWMAHAPGNHLRVHHVITIGTPHQGTWLARLSRTTNAMHMRPGSDWLSRLAQREPCSHAEKFTCFYGHADNIVMPPSAALLSGAASCHVAHTGHVAMAFHASVIKEVSRWL